MRNKFIAQKYCISVVLEGLSFATDRGLREIYTFSGVLGENSAVLTATKKSYTENHGESTQNYNLEYISF